MFDPQTTSGMFPEIVHPKKRAFLAAYAETGTIVRAAAAAKIDPRTHTSWKQDPEYATAFAVARELAAQYLEAEARRRAHDGLIRYKFHLGQPLLHPVTHEPYYELEYSDTLLIFLLKGLRPEVYRERYEHTGAGGGPIETVTRIERIIVDRENAQTISGDTHSWNLPMPKSIEGG